MQKNKTIPFSYITHRNKLEMDYGLDRELKQ